MYSITIISRNTYLNIITIVSLPCKTYIVGYIQDILTYVLHLFSGIDNILYDVYK